MKIRIKGNTVRLRLTQSEVNEFGTKGLVEESAQFGASADSKLNYALIKADCQTLEASFKENKIQISVPQNMATNWVNTELVGLENNDSAMKVLIEKDFACLKARDGEDESDMFPHPEEETSKC